MYSGSQGIGYFQQSLFRITSLEISFIYIVIYYWFSKILNWLFIYFLRMIFSFVTVLVFVSYLTRMIFNFFSCIHVLNTIVNFIFKSISFSFVVVLSSLFRIVIERVIRFSSLDSFSFLRLSRFSIH